MGPDNSVERREKERKRGRGETEEDRRVGEEEKRGQKMLWALIGKRRTVGGI